MPRSMAGSLSTVKPGARAKQGRGGAASSTGIQARVDALARNLWWTWNHDAQRVFAALDPVLWDATQHNPIRTLRQLPPERLAALADDRTLLDLLKHAEVELAKYLKTRTWFERTASPKNRRMLVAYFCAEFALHESMPQYAGGLGVLAGDHLRSASDLGVPLVGVGLIYRHGYYRQQFAADGATQVVYPVHDFAQWPIIATGKSIRVPVSKRKVKANIWKMQVGRVAVYLLDTDIDGNPPADRYLTQPLYGGDQELRIQQEILLGIGGLMALDAMKLKPTTYHLNEGHAAFCNLERLRRLVKARVPYEKAVAQVRASAVFTTHTPVPEGNDRFPPKLFNQYLGGYAREWKLDAAGLLGLGREDPSDRKEPFCMTVLGLRLSGKCNGVAALHGDTSRRMWQRVYRASRPDDVHIGHVTNGVHTQTWLAPEMTPLYDKYLKPHWLGAGPEHDPWAHADRIPPEELWAARGLLRRRMIHFIRQRLMDQVRRRGGPAAELAAVHQTFDGDALTLGFSRRFALYKRAALVFHDPERFAAILSNPRRPVQIVFAGKAHPLDKAGQALAADVFRRMQDPRFAGRVVLLDEYDMQIGRMLTCGSDVWLNNPLRPQEASGTSGMKPPLHGGINCSILDGWWPECFNGRNGWAIGSPEPQATRAEQDAFDAESIYSLLENEIVPLFYERDEHGLPRGWIERMVESMKTVGRAFSSHRMVAEYAGLYGG